MTAPRSDTQRLVERATWLHALHAVGNPLVLPNAWDAASARVVAEAGFAAVATSSGAMAATLGYADHEAAPSDEIFAAVERICRVVDVPVTADLEAGYGLGATELVARILDAGAVGCNIEDTDHRTGARTDPATQSTYLAAIREAASETGVPLVLNARIDSWLHDATSDERFDDAVQRAECYLRAGASCVYPIALSDPATIRRFVDAVTGPVNILATPGGISVADAARLGVARVSYGTSLFRGQQTNLRQALARITAASSD